MSIFFNGSTGNIVKRNTDETDCQGKTQTKQIV